MGTDIHTIFQTKKSGKWIDVKSTFKENRHYFLFAWLAGVRNGFGFAGVRTHTPIVPISSPRGFPKDFDMSHELYHKTSSEALADWRKEYSSVDDNNVWMGDHSHSWLMLDEILKSPLPICEKTGVISTEDFKKWDGKEPDNYCGNIYGPGVFVANSQNDIKGNTTHVRVSWNEFGDSLGYFLDEIKRLRELHGPQTRMVFGFDS